MLAIAEREKKESKKKQVERQLRELINSGSYKSGDKLPSERELAEALSVGRNVLREAIASLVSEGLFEVRERQGIFFKGVEGLGMVDSLHSLQMLPADVITYQMETRLMYEVPAARLAAVRRTDDDIRALRNCYDSFTKCPYFSKEEQAQSGKWEALLHHLVTLAAHNPILSRLNESINSLAERNNILLHHNLLCEEGWMEEIRQHHKTIIDAVADGDYQTAGDTLKLHLIETLDLLARKYPDQIKISRIPQWLLK